MNRKLIVLNLALLALAAALAWLVREHWRSEQAHERSVMEKAARAAAILPPPPLTPPKPVAPADYIQVAQQDLFSKDRNPNVIIEPPPPPPPPPPMPALPSYHGQMTLGEPVVLLSAADSGALQKSYHAGDKIGPFEIVSFDRDKITFDWNGKTVERKIEDLKPKETAQTQAARAAGAPAPSAPKVLVPAAIAAQAPTPKNNMFGERVADQLILCKPGDTTPAGTVVDGYKKVVSQGIFDSICRWEMVK